MSPELVAELFGLLAEGGEIYLATDVFAIALDAMAALEHDVSRRFVNLREPWTFLRESPFVARSRRERQCEAAGIHIWRLGYRRI
jgi:tRNA G46 methylase TrmB